MFCHDNPLYNGKRPDNEDSVRLTVDTSSGDLSWWKLLYKCTALRDLINTFSFRKVSFRRFFSFSPLTEESRKTTDTTTPCRLTSPLDVSSLVVVVCCFRLGRSQELRTSCPTTFTPVDSDSCRRRKDISGRGRLSDSLHVRPHPPVTLTSFGVSYVPLEV